MIDVGGSDPSNFLIFDSKFDWNSLLNGGVFCYIIFDIIFMLPRAY